MIDTHTHLYAEEFAEDIDEVLQRAVSQGVEACYLPAINSETHSAMLALQARYPKLLFAMMGLHPCYVKVETWEQELEIVKQYLDTQAFCAVGEIGIDLFWNQSTLEVQQKAFAQQIEWAIEKKMPIVVHSRESFDACFDVVKTYKNSNLKGVFHCFSGTLEQAELLIEAGFLLGIGGVATFKNGKIDQFLDKIPVSAIVLETDSPYLAPVPYRGKRNESAYLRMVGEKLCSIYDKTFDEIDQITSDNARKLFVNVQFFQV